MSDVEKVAREIVDLLNKWGCPPELSNLTRMAVEQALAAERVKTQAAVDECNAIKAEMERRHQYVLARTGHVDIGALPPEVK